MEFEDEDDDIMILHSSINSNNENHQRSNLPVGISSDEKFANVDGVEGYGLMASECDLQAVKTWIYPTNFPVRDYQYNISKAALMQNTLVCLPTGLGKTFIAAVLMYNYYRWFPTSKIVFMAPTKPLVNQQIEACFNIMGIHQEHTAVLTGTKAPAKRAQTWRNHRILFLTPQVLVNDLSRGLCLNKSIKLVVVDEAHKALGDYAYCQVIKILKEQNYDFRVLALSATPGSDIIAVQQVISNLLISHIEMRNEESLDIREYTHNRKIEKIVVKMEGVLEDTKNCFFEIIKPYVQRLLDHQVLFTRDEQSLTKFQILKSREAFRQNPPMNMPQQKRGMIEGSFAVCMTLYHALELLVMHGIRSFYNFLKAIVDSTTHASRGELTKNLSLMNLMSSLSEKYDQPLDSTQQNGHGKILEASHPKIVKLKQIVVEHFESYHKENLSTRVMIFSQYRDSVTEITEHLKHCGSLIKPWSFIGQSSVVKGKKGFSQNEQLRVIKRFKDGGFNTLISTCVGEEGLDIGDVDLIICYDVLKSPTRLVQRMGRTGRKREGRIVILVTEGREEKLYVESNYKKKSLNTALNNGNRLSHVLYRNNPRMIPQGLVPECIKMKMSIKTWTAAEKGKKPHVAKKIFSFFNKEGTFPKGFKKNGKFLNSEEELQFQQNFKLSAEEIAKINHLPPCLMQSISFKNGIENNSKRYLGLINLGSYQPWQTMLQPSINISHSLQSHHLVELTEFIDLQMCLGSNNDSYGQELSPYLNLSKFEAANFEDSKISFANNKSKPRKTIQSMGISCYMKKTKSRKKNSNNETPTNHNRNIFDNADIEVVGCISSDNISKDSTKSTIAPLLSSFREDLDIFSYITPKKDSFLYIKQPPTESPSFGDSIIQLRPVVEFVKNYNEKLKMRRKLRFESLFSDFEFDYKLDDSKLVKGRTPNNAIFSEQASPVIKKACKISPFLASFQNEKTDLMHQSVSKKSINHLTTPSPSQATDVSKVCHIPFKKGKRLFDELYSKYPCDDLPSRYPSNDDLPFFSCDPKPKPPILKEYELEIQMKHKRKPPEVEHPDEMSPIIRRRPSSQLCTSTPVPVNARKLFKPAEEVTPILRPTPLNMLNVMQKTSEYSEGAKSLYSPENFKDKEIYFPKSKKDSSIAVNFNLSLDLFSDEELPVEPLEEGIKGSLPDLPQNNCIIVNKIQDGNTLSDTLLTETQVLQFLEGPTPEQKRLQSPLIASINDSLHSCPTKSSVLSAPIPKYSFSNSKSDLGRHVTSGTWEEQSACNQNIVEERHIEKKDKINLNSSNQFTGSSYCSNANAQKMQDKNLSETPIRNEATSDGWLDCKASKISKVPILFHKLPSKCDSHQKEVSFDIGLSDFEEWDNSFVQKKISVPKMNFNKNINNQNSDKSLIKNRLTPANTLDGQTLSPVQRPKMDNTNQNISLNTTDSPISFKRRLNGVCIFSDDEEEDELRNRSSHSNKAKSNNKNGDRHEKEIDLSSTSVSKREPNFQLSFDDDFVDLPTDVVDLCQNSPVKKKKKKQKKTVAFIDMEADVSVDDGHKVSSDESEDELDCFDESFVDDLTQPTQQERDMKAVYLQSVKSPPMRKIIVGRLHQPNKSSSSEHDTTYLDNSEDSFVVDNDFVEYETQHLGDSYLAEDPIINKALESEGKKRKTDIEPKSKKRRRIIQLNDSETEEETEVMIIPPHKKKKNVQSDQISPKEEITFDFRVDLLSDEEFQTKLTRTKNANKSDHNGAFTLPRNKSKNVSLIPEERSTQINSFHKKENETKFPNLATTKEETTEVTFLASSKKPLVNIHNSTKNFKPGITEKSNLLLINPHKSLPAPPILSPCMTESVSVSENGSIKTACPTFFNSSMNKHSIDPVSKGIFKKHSSNSLDVCSTVSKNDFKDMGVSTHNTSIDISMFKSPPSRSQSSISLASTSSNKADIKDITFLNSQDFLKSQPSIKVDSALLEEPFILVDSSEVSFAGLITSKLRMTHGFKTIVTQLYPASYVLSSRMAVLRQSYSNFSSNNNKTSLVERIIGLLKLYERPVVIVEADNGITVRNIRRSLYTDSIACAFAQLPQLKLLHAANRDEVTALIHKLFHSERAKGHAIPSIEEETSVMKFYKSFPKINCASAIFLSKEFHNICDFLSSNADELIKKGRLSRSQAAAVLSHIKRNFRKDLLPPSIFRN